MERRTGNSGFSAETKRASWVGGKGRMGGFLLLSLWVRMRSFKKLSATMRVS